MENATEKQVDFIKKLSVRLKKELPDFQYLTKDGAKTLLDDWLNEGQKPAEKEKVAQNGSNGEIHLTIESVRSNALNCAVKYAELLVNGLDKENLTRVPMTSEQIVTVAGYFEKYILNGVQEK